MEAIEWEDPPPSRSRNAGTSFAAARAELKAHPGKWGIVAVYKSVNEAAARLPVFKSRGFEATSRTRADGAGVLYARWPEVTP